jgi:hypothetical protein
MVVSFTPPNGFVVVAVLPAPLAVLFVEFADDVPLLFEEAQPATVELFALVVLVEVAALVAHGLFVPLVVLVVFVPLAVDPVEPFVDEAEVVEVPDEFPALFAFVLAGAATVNGPI